MAMLSPHGPLIFAACALSAAGCEKSDLAASPRNLSSAGSANVGALGGAGSDVGGAAGDASRAGSDVGGAAGDASHAGSDVGGAAGDASRAGSDAGGPGSAGALPEVESAGAAGRAEPPEVCLTASAQSAPSLIDDFEDGNNVLQPSNRHGYWYANNDGSGIQVPEPDPSGASFRLDAPGSPSSGKHALHTTGSGFTLWGAFVSTSLNVQANRLCPYDVTSFSGIRFNAKGSGALRVELGTRVTTPVSDGGECASLLCSDYGLDVNLSSDWASVSIPFDAVQLPVWASPAQWTPDAVVRLSFWVEHGGFDFWIDDVTFY